MFRRVNGQARAVMIGLDDIVPGDLVMLSSGANVPADMRVLAMADNYGYVFVEKGRKKERKKERRKEGKGVTVKWRPWDARNILLSPELISRTKWSWSFL